MVFINDPHPFAYATIEEMNAEGWFSATDAPELTGEKYSTMSSRFQRSKIIRAVPVMAGGRMHRAAQRDQIIADRQERGGRHARNGKVRIADIAADLYKRVEGDPRIPLRDLNYLREIAQGVNPKTRSHAHTVVKRVEKASRS